jgi:diacylglycerol kinase family enzyme
MFPKHIIISVNPKAGRKSPAKRAEELHAHLQYKGFTTELLHDLDEVVEKANALHTSGMLRALVGVGGDGTAATLVNRTIQGTPVTLLTAGTANLLAKHYRLPSRPAKLADVIEYGTIRTFDAGLARFNNTERLFLVMASCGFDADVVNGVHAHREERYRQGHVKGAHISYMSYVKPVIKSLRRYKFPMMTVECVDNVSGCTASAVWPDVRWAFVFNINRYAWGLPLAPFAKENDGKLDHVLFRGGTPFHGVFYTALAQCFSLHRFLPTVRLDQGVRYRLSSSESVPFQLDGDPVGELPLELEIVPNRFTFLLPNRAGQRRYL